MEKIFFTNANSSRFLLLTGLLALTLPVIGVSKKDFFHYDIPLFETFPEAAFRPAFLPHAWKAMSQSSVI